MAGGNDVFDMTGRVALITGGAGGIARAVSEVLGARGAAIALVDVREPDLDAAVAELTARGVRAFGAVADITDEQAVEDLVDRASEALGTVDMLVNNAAIGVHTAPEHLAAGDWRRVLDVDLTGGFLVARAVGRRLIEHGRGGAVVNLSSIAGSSALGRGNFAYSVAKGGVNQLTRELAVEWAPCGIRVNAIQPCQVNTALFRTLVDTPGPEGPELLAHMLRGIPLGRLAEPADIAHAVLFLLSDASAMVTGAILPVDGGNLSLNAGGSLRAIS
ncbi:SDR family NAD(P)-dependent oxidoreductase [Sphaerisporangium rubeum]|uniref:NAD(P)-dependent dehydrogenase (Short-subunit alcohol dehydrogenase family) n=1 Tax=Sphaerisporangium rubeum TaxID=321317 RepID=A0A7X0IIB3_9ACTN|nr:SDR family NAD(P)-dependent oxidoreductase [Sphaerisporangium rubeum]MBB6475717.1 NAD(P)-dependent dehydrogenase (short-subunit alcohol dehydrogenase family) [Sphaerisporangium rubeum]